MQFYTTLCISTKYYYVFQCEWEIGVHGSRERTGGMISVQPSGYILCCRVPCRQLGKFGVKFRETSCWGQPAKGRVQKVQSYLKVIFDPYASEKVQHRNHCLIMPRTPIEIFEMLPLWLISLWVSFLDLSAYSKLKIILMTIYKTDLSPANI